jgi:chromosome partitioning protein
MTQRSRPRVVVFLGQKGGSGKTTLAVHVAVAAQADAERVVLIDTDPQASATAWAESRQEERPPVVTVSPTQVGDVLATAQDEGITLAVIDTAPHAAPGAAQAVREADLIILPCRPTAFDLRAIGAAVAIASASRKPSAIVLNACPPRAPEVPEAQSVLQAEHRLPVIPTPIGDRRALSRAIATGRAVTEFEPGGRAAEEIRTLWSWIKEHLP